MDRHFFRKSGAWELWGQLIWGPLASLSSLWFPFNNVPVSGTPQKHLNVQSRFGMVPMGLGWSTLGATLSNMFFVVLF